MTKPASDTRQRELARFVAAMSDAVLHCRDHGHSWKPYDAERLPRNQGFIRWLRCAECDMIRRQVLDRYGVVESNSYSNRPTDYSVTGMGPLTTEDRAQFHLVAVLGELEVLKRA